MAWMDFLCACRLDALVSSHVTPVANDLRAASGALDAKPARSPPHGRSGCPGDLSGWTRAQKQRGTDKSARSAILAAAQT